MNTSSRIARSLILTGLLWVVPHVEAAGTVPDIRIEIPASFIDGEPLIANVRLTNLNDGPLEAGVANYTNLRVTVTTIESKDTGCLVRRMATGRAGSPRDRKLIPSHGSVEVKVDLAGEFPLGLRPGRYTVVVEYRDGSIAAKSVPAPFTVAAPTGARVGEYDAFIKTCKAVVLGSAGAPSDALEFTRAHPTFGLADSLLNLARLRASGDARIAIDQALTQRKSRYSSGATADLEQAEAALLAAERRASYERQVEVEVKKPENKDAVRDFHALTTIQESIDFSKYEQFLRDHPTSFFAPAVLQRMINAVQEGVLPLGYDAKERDRALRHLYSRLTNEYPESYHSKEVARSETAQRLLATRTTE